MSSLASSALVLSLIALAPLSVSAAGSSDYETVRRIAQRDARVQDAFAKANQKLDEKIVQIDPTLTSYVRTHPSGRAASTTPAPAKPTASAPKKSTAPATGQTHVVKSGETLSSIAAKYGVSPESLQGTNRIRDEKKLKVGQTLVIPAKR
jgi:LysM repeat protein